LSAWVALGAVSCGQSAPTGPSPVPAGGNAGAPGGAGASAAGSGGLAGSATGGSATAGMAGLGNAGTLNAGGAGGAAGGSDGGSGGGSGGTAGAIGTGSGCSAPGTLCWDFEEGMTPNGWTKYRDEFNGTLAVDNTKPHKGSYSLHAKDLMGGSEGVQGGPKKTLRYNLPANFGPVLWGRVWVYTTASPQSHSGLFNARYPRPGTADTDISKLDWYEVATYTAKYMTIWHPPEPPGFPEWVKVSGTAGVVNDWACLEWFFDGKNGAAAEAADPRLWLNGSELTWPMEYVFSDPATSTRPTQEKATNFTLLETGVYLYQGLPAATNTWLDDLAVGKERIGCQ